MHCWTIEALFATKGNDKHGKAFLMHCMLSSVIALNKLSFVEIIQIRYLYFGRPLVVAEYSDDPLQFGSTISERQ